MLRNHIRTFAATTAALGVALSLGACSVGPVNIDEFLMNTSVAEARAAARDALSPVVTDDALHQAGTLTVGILATETAPLALTTSDGTQSGIDIDTACALADALGLASVSFVPVSNVSTALQDQCDIVMGVTAEEAGDAMVVGSYVQNATGLFTKQAVTAPVDATALSGARMGVQGESVSQAVLSDYDLDVTQQTFSNLNEAFDALDAGTVDYVVCDAYSGAYLSTAYTDVSFAGVLDEVVPVGIAVSSAELQTALQSALDEISTNGVGDIARARWVGSLPALSEVSRVTGLVEAPAADDSDDADADQADANADSDDATSADGQDDAAEGEEGLGETTPAE